MTGKILFLGGRPWRAGLDWTAPGPALSVSGIRREAALRGADLVVLRGPRGSRQTGCAEAGGGRAPSLAAALCRALSGEKGVLLSLRLKDAGGASFWWVLGILGGAVAPGYGDQVHATEEDAGQAAVRLARLAGGREAFSLRAASADPGESAKILTRLLARGGMPGRAARFAWRCRPVRSRAGENPAPWPSGPGNTRRKSFLRRGPLFRKRRPRGAPVSPASTGRRVNSRAGFSAGARAARGPETAGTPE